MMIVVPNDFECTDTDCELRTGMARRVYQSEVCSHDCDIVLGLPFISCCYIAVLHAVGVDGGRVVGPADPVCARQNDVIVCTTNAV